MLHAGWVQVQCIRLRSSMPRLAYYTTWLSEQTNPVSLHLVTLSVPNLCPLCITPFCTLALCLLSSESSLFFSKHLRWTTSTFCALILDMKLVNFQLSYGQFNSTTHVQISLDVISFNTSPSDCSCLAVK